MRVALDIESRSEANLKSVGNYRYIEHPSTRILTIGISVDGALPFIWHPGEPRPMCFGAKGASYVSHNTQFDRGMLDRHLFKTDISQWDDTMARCLYHILPAALDDVAQVLFGRKKDPRGEELIKNTSGKGVCMPQRKRGSDDWYWNNDPFALHELDEYCLNDVELLVLLDKALPPLPEAERKSWVVWCHMNDHGVLIDTRLAERATEVMEDVLLDNQARVERITGGRIASPTQTKAIPQYALELTGRADILPTCQEVDVVNALKKDIPDELREVLLARQTSNSAAVKKYAKALERVCEDGRLRGEMFWYGAHTGRGSSRGVQLQNGKRGKESEYLAWMEALRDGRLGADDKWVDWNYVLSNGVRRMLISAPGRSFIEMDYSGIEARTVSWLTGYEEDLQRVRDGIDGYVVLASSIYGLPESEITKGKRAVGKEARLSGQYGIGWKGYRTRLDRKWDIQISEQEAKLAISTFRRDNWPIKRAWGELEAAWRSAVAGVPAMACKCLFAVENGWMRITCPDGRSLYYFDPDYDISYRVVGRYYKEKETGEAKPLRKHMYGGAILENLAQWISGIKIKDDLIDIDAISYIDICFMVHDSGVFEVDDDKLAQAYAVIEQLMTRPIAWAPDLPIGVEGWIGKWYKKG